jgi:mannose-6-phosphate isomerase-like protein (cupin superfamily)
VTIPRRFALDAIHLTEKLSRFDDTWAPRIIGQLNNYHVMLAKIQGKFIWHSHPETDELFLVLHGSMVIAFRDKEVPLAEGDMLIVPAGVEHKPRAAEECHILLIEPVGTVNTGDAGANGSRRMRFGYRSCSHAMTGPPRE